jgi:hypothetical protein
MTLSEWIGLVIIVIVFAIWLEIKSLSDEDEKD